ncbi:HD-GYP domain-containing protein [Geobacter sp. SVR]|uniref:HD-GYP domain-containing protein n=1 Tax=Geobacter sp. SVR TaxID=2495594 RepID=UPI00143EFE80|nr:HD-GYP domain-containing protein [Geobacter sp. SVR]BCS53215.1 HD family phosphohydrolase [Geobacter sp. SVR]GCF84600.1 HD family phosphohydrolase [Geobacter sp. SVR]
MSPLLQTCIPLPSSGRNPVAHTGCSEPCLAGCLNLHQFAEALGNAVDAKDPQLFNHSHDVAETGRILAGAMGLDPTEVELVHIAGHLHDIGKIGIPDVVLQKQGALDRNEWCWMKRHPEIGAEIVRPVAPFNTPGGVADIILGHHEQYDGSGYPQGLRKEHIPLGARIVAVADTLSALLRDRPYRRGCSFEQALAEIRRCSGSQFDPAVIGMLGRRRDEIREILAAPEAFLARRFSERILGAASAAA